MYLLFLVVNNNTSFEFSHLGRSIGRCPWRKRLSTYKAIQLTTILGAWPIAHWIDVIVAPRLARSIAWSWALFASYFDILPWLHLFTSYLMILARFSDISMVHIIVEILMGHFRKCCIYVNTVLFFPGSKGWTPPSTSSPTLCRGASETSRSSRTWYPRLLTILCWKQNILR